MPADLPRHRPYTATAVVDFPRVDEFLDPILASIATHDMTVERESGRYRVGSAFGTASLEARQGQLYLAIETGSPSALNRLKHALAGPIAFIAASQMLEIHWSGDEAGPAPLDDLRILHVVDAVQLTPRMRRIVFRGDDLARFDRPDQLHCRLIFQPKGLSSWQWPMLDDRGHVAWPQQRKLPTRVYTLRRVDAAKGEITIDFSLHSAAGPATAWALAAAAGDAVGIVGPAAGGPKPADFYVLAGDETGLPGIARMLEWLDAKARGVAFVEIDGPGEEQSLRRPAGVELRWLHRNGAAPGTASLLPDAVRSAAWPPALGQAFFWGGCEHRAFREIHRLLRHDIRLPRDRQILYSHWHRALSEEQIIAIGGKAYLAE